MPIQGEPLPWSSWREESEHTFLQECSANPSEPKRFFECGSNALKDLVAGSGFELRPLVPEENFNIARLCLSIT